MKGGYESHGVVRLERVRQAVLQVPVHVIDQHKDPGASGRGGGQLVGWRVTRSRRGAPHQTTAPDTSRQSPHAPHSHAIRHHEELRPLANQSVADQRQEGCHRDPRWHGQLVFFDLIKQELQAAAAGRAKDGATARAIARANAEV